MIIAAHTNFDPTYPGYINVSKRDDGAVVVIVRGDPKEVQGAFVCSTWSGPGRCKPGDANCNNYCNMAPEKGLMQPAPKSCTNTHEGATAQLTLSAEVWAQLKERLAT